MFWIMGLLTVVMMVFVLNLIYKQEIETTKEQEHDLNPQPKKKTFTLPNFIDSGWVLFYVICGWLGVFGFILFLILEKGKGVAAYFMLGSSLSCFFAAHVLRLQEKTAYFSETTAEESKKQTKLLEKLNKD